MSCLQLFLQKKARLRYKNLVWTLLITGRHLARPYNIDDDEEEDEDGGNYSSPCPDYEEVDPLQIQRLRLALQNTDLSEGQNKAVSAAAPSPALTSNTTQQQQPPPPLPRLPMTNGLLGHTSPEPGAQLRRSPPNGIKIGLGSGPSVIRNVRNRWSANLESVKGFMTGSDFSRSQTEEAHKQETIMKSVVNCIHKVSPGSKMF